MSMKRRLLSCLKAQIGLIAAVTPSACSSPSPSSGADAGAPDAARSDAGGGADAKDDSDPSACAPKNVSGFVPPPFVPIRKPSLACQGFNGDGGLVQAYGDACLGHQSSEEACASFTPGDAAGAADCYACLASAESPDAGAYGAVVVASVPLVNYAGCVDALDPDGGPSCARTASTAASCAEYACKSSCPVRDQTSWNDYMNCFNAALSGGCSGYWLSAQSCLLAASGDPSTPVGAVCFGGMTAEDHYFTLAHYFCGGG